MFLGLATYSSLKCFFAVSTPDAAAEMLSQMSRQSSHTISDGTPLSSSHTQRQATPITMGHTITQGTPVYTGQRNPNRLNAFNR